MKANEAPEKIYIDSNLENRTWLIGKGDTSFIEYTRTDAFIKKACDAYCWLCDTKECDDTGECNWVKKFRKLLMRWL